MPSCRHEARGYELLTVETPAGARLERAIPERSLVQVPVCFESMHPPFSQSGIDTGMVKLRRGASPWQEEGVTNPTVSYPRFFRPLRPVALREAFHDDWLDGR